MSESAAAEGVISKSYEVKEFLNQYKISDRESDVFLLLANGVTTTNEISEILHLSPNTISNHLNSLLAKTNSKNKSELLSSFLRLNARKLNETKLMARRPTILVVDTNADNCISIHQNLTLRGFRVFMVHNPENVSPGLYGTRPDLILVEKQLADYDGLQLIRDLQVRHENLPQTVLVTSAAAEPLDPGEDMEVVVKPINFNQVAFMALDTFIESPKTRSRFHRVDADHRIRINGAEEYQLANLGFGGAAVEVSRAELLRDRRYRKGRRLSWQMHLEGRDLGGEAEICWIRKKDQVGLKAGMGIKFINPPKDVRNHLRDYVRNKKYVSLGPL